MNLYFLYILLCFILGGTISVILCDRKRKRFQKRLDDLDKKIKEAKDNQNEINKRINLAKS